MAELLRRTLVQAALGLGAGAGAGAANAQTVTLPFGNGERPLVSYPQKRPLIRLTTRPPQLETPFAVYDEGVLTPNDAFFVRYHLAGAPPTDLDPDTFRLLVQGLVDNQLALSLKELKAMPAVEIVAVNQCSGNGRGFFEPRVGGGQAGNGLMGNARWRGVPLKGVLEKAGVKAGAVQVRFDGMDGPVLPETPDFAKALDLAHALDGEVMLAWGMNGADLPILNGYPLRLVVPGYYGTYWVKHVNEITVLDKPLDNFWMSTAYRVPDNDCACVTPGTAPAKTRPIGRFKVRSFITNLADGAKVAAGRQTLLRGMAFDGGSGIAEVAVSADGGASWTPARLGPDLGRYAFRPWSAQVRLTAGRHALKVKATSHAGETQPAEQPWNPSGYLRNLIETVTVEAA
ncbi:SorA family sulfite dehydrogenase catalytic subunit [Phenylobacterium montanum]|uniref:Molybdopterin-dependent oxidoreductase n=1 Tax=Phenylobacterium montanum TaxID=2823693 RepID=A0A975FWM6_9CAUL|nr:molybdopterin-dependent oxidoreductase [Caulobacter sp. S6]QUD86319.1 molybdopterin-dependent oxidoreductase [Caulobacter sp. S6]